MKKSLLLILAALLTTYCNTWAAELSVTMHGLTDTGTGEALGQIKAVETEYGTIFLPDLKGLTPGIHGFHIHQKPSCEPSEKNGKIIPGLAAGGHYDPGMTNSHLGPYADGHLGDLPVLYFNSEGVSSIPVLAPRLQLKDLAGRSLMIHAGGDNYSDTPKKLGGGGSRAACGVVK